MKNKKTLEYSKIFQMEFVPILRWMDYGGLEKKLKSLSRKMDEFLQALIDEQRCKEEEGNTMIDHMLSLQKLQPDYYTDQIIKGLILVSTLNRASSLVEKTRK